MGANRLQVLGEETDDEPVALVPPPAPAVAKAAQHDKVAVEAWVLVGLALKVLSTRTVALAGHLLPLIALALGFALAWSIRDNPTTYQLALLGFYALFALLMIWVRRV